MRRRWGALAQIVVAASWLVSEVGRADDAALGSALGIYYDAHWSRLSCIADQDIELCTRSVERYGAAAAALDAYVERHPGDPRAVDLRFLRAEALRFSDRISDALGVLSALRDDPRAATRRTEALTRSVEYASEAKRLIWVPPPAEPRPSVPAELPPVLRDYVDACLELLQAPPEPVTTTLRADCEYTSATTLLQYGHVARARPMLERIVDANCEGPDAANRGLSALGQLVTLASETNDLSRRDRLFAQRRRCPFGRPWVDCSGSSLGSAPIPRDAPPWSCAPALIRDVETLPPPPPACGGAGWSGGSRSAPVEELMQRAYAAPSVEERERLQEQAAVELYRLLAHEPGRFTAMTIAHLLAQLGHTQAAVCFAEGAEREAVRLGVGSGQVLTSIAAQVQLFRARALASLFDFEGALALLRPMLSAALPAYDDDPGWDAESLTAELQARSGALREAARHYRRLARTVTSPEARAGMLAMGAEWEARSRARHATGHLQVPPLFGPPPLDPQLP